MISSLAVASRITPLRCRLPCSSTNPLGSVNSNSVLNAIAVELPPYRNPPWRRIERQGGSNVQMQLRSRSASPSARQRLSELALLEDDLEPLGGVARALRVERGTVPLRREAVEEVDPPR